MPVRVTPEELRVRLAQRVRDVAERRRMNLGQVAAEAGISRRHLSDVLAGRASPSLDVLAKLAMALQVDPGELVRAPKRAGAPGGGRPGAPAE